MRRIKSKSLQLKMEACEDRVLMAGDVAVALEGSLLTLYGDDAANQVSIVQATNGNVRISGLTGTTINGQSSLLLTNPQLNAIDARMEGGNDSLLLQDVRVTNDIFANLGSGDDLIRFVRTDVGANTAVEGDQGDDRAVLVDSLFAEDLNLNLGIHRGVVSISRTEVGGSATLITDDASDTFNLVDFAVGLDLKLESKGGNDVVSLRRVSATKIDVATDAGADRVTLSTVRASEDININTGVGDDRVTMVDLAAGKSLTVNTDAGNDYVVATSVRAAEQVSLIGGAGFDTLDDNGISAGDKREIKEFERFV